VLYDIPLSNDGVTEGRESFNLSISDMLHPNVTLGTTYQTVVSIVDDASMLYYRYPTRELKIFMQVW